ncbi:MAG: 3-phosphoserine/phosphohydroxythreonine transaminase [Myxococcales bacterium]|nr:3-phosphoserine/phosphohydroxythreonine transaminase [Myxococcales bacterium]
MTHRAHNFNPGPATIPLSVLEKVQAELLDFEGSGMSLMEHSHRGPTYAAVHAEAKSLLRELMGIPDTHEILFMQGGASAQFALIPMNLLGEGQSADYVITGAWSKKAIGEAKIVGQARVAADPSSDGKFIRIPSQAELELDPKARYVHITTNNTIAGTQFFEYPKTGEVPLIADMSSDILWRPIDVSKFGMIYAGAQKNLGPSGVTLVIIRKDLVESGRKDIPKIFRYQTIVDGDSLQNTGPTFSIYMVRNMLRWVKEHGGGEGMEKRNRDKAAILYAAIDAKADFFRCPVERASRSMMNVVFRLPSETLEKEFIAEAAAKHIVGIKGHRSVGGIRASIYNAMPPESVRALVTLMNDFAARKG